MEKNKIVNLCVMPSNITFDVICGITNDITHYRTGYGNCGLWEIVYEEKDGWHIKKERQLIGECDFRLDQETCSGIRKALSRYFNS